MKLSKQMFKTILSLLLAFLILAFTGCKKEENYGSMGKVQFSEYYKNAIGFSEFEPYLQKFFWVLQNAYLESVLDAGGEFKYDKKQYQKLTEILDTMLTQDVSGDVTDPNSEAWVRYKSRLEISSIYNHLKTVIAEYDLSKRLPSVDRAWIKHIKEEIDKARELLSDEEGLDHASLSDSYLCKGAVLAI